MKLQIEVPDPWSEFGTAVFVYALERIEAETGNSGWWTYLPVHILDNRLIGSCGFKGKPNPSGMVEIGYEVIPSYRGQGYGTEIARGMISHAFTDDRVTTVRAHTLAAENASVAILRKCGLRFAGTFMDPDDGEVWRWEVTLKEWRRRHK